MVRPLSIDLRERVVRDVQEGASRRGAAKRFGIAPSAAIKLMRHVQATGGVAPKPSGGDRRGKLKAHRDWILARVREVPDISLSELAQELEGRGVTIHPSNISRYLIAHGLSFKKNPAGRRAKPPRRS